MFGGEKEGSNLAHLNSDYIKEEYKPKSKTRFSTQINLKLYINLNVARESSPLRRSVLHQVHPKKMLAKLKKSQIKHFTKGKYN